MSRKQWIGLLLLILMLAAIELTAYLTRRWREKQPVPYLFELQPEREQDFVRYMDSLREAEYAARYPKHEKRAIRLQPFDPNTADSALLVTVGMQPWMAHNLIRYRQAGKIFRRKDELRRLYGMTDSLYTTLEPFIMIDSTLTHSAMLDSTVQDSITRSWQAHLKRDTILELNTADTAELQLLRGIGRYTAVQIVRYRSELGGYYSTAQLSDSLLQSRVPQLTSERIDSLLPHLMVDTSLIAPIQINRASVRQLQRHPYLTYKQAEQIYDLRRRKIHLQSISELTPILTSEEQQKLAPYLRFDQQ